MLQAAHDYIQANRAGQTEIWICSDLRDNDWNADSGRWQTLREQFPRIHAGRAVSPAGLPASRRRAIVGARDRRSPRTTADGAELLVSLHLAREQGDDTKVTIPVQFEIDGARSELTVEMTGARVRAQGPPHSALAADQKRGWGHVSIPADANPADNDFYFVFDEPPPRQTIIVADDPQAVHAQQLAAEITARSDA